MDYAIYTIIVGVTDGNIYFLRNIYFQKFI